MKISFYVSVILFGVISAVPMRGDLLAIPADNGNSSPAVLRFDERTGAFINQFGHETEGYEGIALSRDGKIYVTSNILGYGDVHHFNRDGQYQGGFTNGNLRTPGRLAFGPDGNCYVLGSSWPNTPERWQILRYNGATGLFKDTFITNAGMPRDLAFGTDGRLYVADASRGIVRYHGTTGAFIDTFAALASGKAPDIQAFIFGPDGNLYACSWTSNAVARFDGHTGAFLGYFVASGSGGLNQPGGLGFGPDGNLYVSSTLTHTTLRYDGRTGKSLGIFASDAQLRFPAALVFLASPPS